MEAQENKMQTPKKSSSNLWMYIVLIILALGIIGLSVWLISLKNNMKDLVTEKELQRIELQTELDSLVFQHERMKVAYGEISDSLVIMDSVIQANAKEIKQILNFKC
jgi:flagellar basal body-associated protein FliL